MNRKSASQPAKTGVKDMGEKERSHLMTTDPHDSSPDSQKTKRSLNNSDRRTLLYNYYARGLAPMYNKRNFDEIDRYSKFSGKRNFELADHTAEMGLVKRNFDEIDRWAGFNSRLNHDRNMIDYVKRNFDEIDRYGKFNKRPFHEVEDFGGYGSSLSDEMGIINEYSQ
ncbi:orcokinin peptides type A-like isoform X2 [Toxorhynchites rutilus septentrionalis]|uniref:orcokinin peptides type A-like isoform X2 n=1 Tax=Toxorhynchites rutilus septentrionalis TaxID=329112 RepID=UPI00247AB8B6|nr:orcokinin peptides type A-like isoform X2 [Toxorhynchites rutilus septentrionalis]